MAEQICESIQGRRSIDREGVEVEKEEIGGGGVYNALIGIYLT